jgi:transcriptional regulator with XRE-family HTH domain
MKELDIKQIKLSEQLDIDQSYISMLMNGKREISKIMALSLQNLYNISPTWLLTGEGEMFLPPREGLVTDAQVERMSGDPRVARINRLLAENPELIGVTDKFLSGTATLKELLEVAEELPEKRRLVALAQIRALRGC